MERITIFILAIFILNFTASAQNDSGHLPQLPFSYMKINSKFLCVFRSKIGVIQNDSDWIKCQSLCKEDSIININFKEYTVWQRNSMGDCHAKFTHCLFINSTAKKIIWEEQNHYGGCRAARFEDFRIVFCKPPAGYTFELREVLEEK